MNKFWFVVILCFVSVIHIAALYSIKTDKVIHIVNPTSKITKVTLSSVVIKKDPPPKKVEPKPKPKEKPKPKPKPKPAIKKTTAAPPVQEPVVKQSVEQQQAPPELSAPVAKIDTSTLLDRYISSVRMMIAQNLHYPPKAKRLGVEGTVLVTFTILQDGTIVTIVMDESSRGLLKRGALKTLQAVSLEPIPDELKQDKLEITLPIKFKLKGG